MNYRTLIALPALLLALMGAVSAHDPGLSSARLELSAARSIAELTFARRDIERLVPIDSRGRISDTLREMAQGALILSTGGRPLAVRSVEIRLQEGDELQIRIEYPAAPGGRLHVSSPLIEQLSRGHRLHLQVRRDGEIQIETILDAGRSGISLLAF